MAKAIEISMHSAQASLRLKSALSEMAIFRQADSDPTFLKIYAARLSSEPLDDVLAALRYLGQQPRREGETAIPNINTVLAAVAHQGILRRRAKATKEAIIQRCEKCGRTVCGFYRPYEEPRATTCNGLRSQGEGACGGEMKLLDRRPL